MEVKSKMIDWFDNLSTNEKLNKIIESKHLHDLISIINVPNKDKIIIYNYNFDHTSIVRSNILEDKGYVPYCDCPRLVRIKSNGVGKQMSCDKCNTTTKFSQEFLDEWTRVHKANLNKDLTEPEECPVCSKAFFTGTCSGCNYEEKEFLHKS